MALFFSAATIAGAFGGLLARAIMKMDHARGLGAWSWIFIIEGAVTVVIGKCPLAVVQLGPIVDLRIWRAVYPRGCVNSTLRLLRYLPN
jgi:MFS family permease